jgi:hypothetical protein
MLKEVLTVYLNVLSWHLFRAKEGGTWLWQCPSWDMNFISPTSHSETLLSEPTSMAWMLQTRRSQLHLTCKQWMECGSFNDTVPTAVVVTKWHESITVSGEPERIAEKVSWHLPEGPKVNLVSWPKLKPRTSQMPVTTATTSQHFFCGF